MEAFREELLGLVGAVEKLRVVLDGRVVRVDEVTGLLTLLRARVAAVLLAAERWWAMARCEGRDGVPLPSATEAGAVDEDVVLSTYKI